MAIPDFPLPRGYAWQYHLILWLQSFHAVWLNKAAIIVSYIGTESFYLLALCVMILACDRRNGLRLTYIFLTSMFLNAWLKSYFHVARPIGVPGVQSGYISSATGLSMPSGHAQGTITFFVGLSRWLRRRLLFWFGMLLVLAIGLSRVYLGLHWPNDVLVGWLLGIVVGSVGWPLGRWWSYRQIPLRYAFVFAVLFPAILFYCCRDAGAAICATFLFAVGTGSVLERKFLRIAIGRRWWQRICAAVIGIGGMIAIQWILQKYASDLPWLLLRDLLIGWWVTFAAPWLFLKVGLYETEEQQGIVD